MTLYLPAQTIVRTHLCTAACYLFHGIILNLHTIKMLATIWIIPILFNQGGAA
jgi:hypothetical protein